MSLSESDSYRPDVSPPDMLFPIYGPIAEDVLESFTIFDTKLYSNNLNKEVEAFKKSNVMLLRYLFNRYERNGGSPEFHGALVMHRILNEQANLTGGRLPHFSDNFPELLEKDRQRRVKLFSEACMIPIREVRDMRSLARVNWFVNHERDFHTVLGPPLESRSQDYLNDFYQGGLGFYYMIKDGLALPEAYS